MYYTLHTAVAKWNDDESIQHTHSTHANYFLTLRRREGSKLWKMRQQFRKWHSPLPPRTQLYRYTRAHDAGITNALGDCFLSTVFPPSPSLRRLRFIVIPLHPENCFGKLLKPVLFLSLRLRQRGDFISFSQFLGKESSYRDAFDTDSTGFRGVTRNLQVSSMAVRS